MYQCTCYDDDCHEYSFTATLPQLYKLFKSGRFILSVIFIDGLSRKTANHLELLPYRRPA